VAVRVASSFASSSVLFKCQALGWSWRKSGFGLRWEIQQLICVQEFFADRGNKTFSA